jgi:putative transposase
MSERTSLKYVYYALQLYSSGLSLRKTSQHLSLIIKRNHVYVWNCIQKYKPKKKILQKQNKIQEFLIDETLIKVSYDYVWVWVAIEPIDKVIPDIRISFERTMHVVE